jgi:hypothetical protein
MKPSDYANHLLEIARSMRERPVFEWSQTTSVAMARRSQLEGRLLAILSRENKRGTVPRATIVSFIALICVMLLSLATIRPTVIHAQHPRAFNIDSNGNEDDSERGFSGSTLDAGAELGGGTAADQNAQPPAVGDKHVDTDVAVGSPQVQALNDGGAAKETGRNLAGDVERIAGSAVAEVIAERSVTVVQMPEVHPLPVQQASPFINAGYRQEHHPQTQSGRGDFIDEMSAAGYPNLSVDELIRLKTAGVNAAYVRSLRALGFNNLTPKELAEMSIHGVTPAYIESLRAAGYNGLSAKELTTFRIHGVTAEYIRMLRDAGFGNLPAKQLVDFKIHQVTPAFVSGIRAAGYGNLSPKELVSLRVHNITPEFIRTARSRLGDLTIKQLVSLKNLGILDDEKGKEKGTDKDKEKDKS